MNFKTKYYSKFRHLYYLIPFYLLFTVTNTLNAQCTPGTSATITVCDITNVNSQTVNLATSLGSHDSGGTWIDNLASGGLDNSTGILNVQKIRKMGTYTYTYSLESVSGCSSSASATITVNVGGYTGVPSPNASVCSNYSGSFNLFQVFKGNSLSPQVNGTWADNDSSNKLTQNFLDISSVSPIGTYSFTYTLPDIDICSSVSSTVYVTIFPVAKAGTPIDDPVKKICSENLGSYTNYYLNEALKDEDLGGVWSEENDTSEITFPTDAYINLQRIYNTKGAGIYSFKYTVVSSNTICPDQFSIVSIQIEKPINASGASLTINPSICQNELNTATLNGVLRQGNQAIPNGTYEITYTVSGESASNTINTTFDNGTASFSIRSSHFQQVGTYTVNVINIVNKTTPSICPDMINGPISSNNLIVYKAPNIDNAILNINSICQNSDATVTISGASNVPDGNYILVYDLSGSNQQTGKSVTLNFTGGNASFSLSKSLIPRTGTTNFQIKQLTNTITNCTSSSILSKDFLIKSVANLSNFNITINPTCENQPLTVALSGLDNLSSIALSYALSGANNVPSQTKNLTVNSGNASFVILPTDIPNIGNTVFEITNLIDLSGNCLSTLPLPLPTKSFSIVQKPNNPTASNQNFCSANHPIVANLTPNGALYRWLDSTNTILNTNTSLVTGIYRVKQIGSIAGCDSGLTLIQVKVNEVSMPGLNVEGEKFCGVDRPTLQRLSANTQYSGKLFWFDAPTTDGTQLENTELLKDEATYYGFNFSEQTQCFSENPLVVTVSLTNCDVSPDSPLANEFLPSGFSPNGDGVNDTFKIPNIEFLYPNFTLEIFNRYGSSVFTMNKNKLEWDGKSSDAAIKIDGNVPNDVYFYVINYNRNNKPPKQGYFYLNQ